MKKKLLAITIVLALAAVGISVASASGWSRPVPVFTSSSVSFSSPHLPDVWRLNLWSQGKLIASTTEPDSGTMTIPLPAGDCGLYQADAARIIGSTYKYYSGSRYQAPACGGSTTTTTGVSTTTTEAPTTTTSTIVSPPVTTTTTTTIPPAPPTPPTPVTGPGSTLGGNGTPGSVSFTG